MTNWAIVPVKNLDYSKSRLSDVLSVDARRELICSLLTRTLSLLNESEFIEKTIKIPRSINRNIFKCLVSNFEYKFCIIHAIYLLW